MADVEPGIKGTCILNFEITSYCNADCPSCFRTRYKEYLPPLPSLIPYKHLQVEDFELLVLNNIDFFKNNQYHKLSAKFCGEIGDPLLHPNIEQLISIAENVFDNIYIFTNGGIRNAKWIKKILTRYRKTIFVFGIDGLTDETNQMYRVNVRTDIALKNMIESVKHGFTKWHYTIFNHNYQELSDVIKFAKNHNLDLLCRFNGREFNKLDDENIVKCEDLLQKNNIGYFVCR